MMIMIILGDGIVGFPLWNFHIGLMMIMVKTHSKRKKNRHNDDVDERRRRVIFPAPRNFVKSLFEIKCCTQRRGFFHFLYSRLC